MTKNFNMKVYYGSKKFGEKTIRLTPTKGKTISFKDIKEFYKQLINTNEFDIENIIIKGMSPDKETLLGVGHGLTTIKKLMDDIKDFDEDEYYADKAKDTTKFENFFWCDFIIYK
jgi:hypothetical protein